MKQILTTLFILLFVVSSSFAQIYVDAAAANGGDGQTWATAYNDLQTAINAAVDGDQVWVAKGIYRPTLDKTGAVPTNPRNKTFYINKSILIYGGFTSGGAGESSPLLVTISIPTNITDINATNFTIFSGDLADDESDVSLSGQQQYYDLTATFPTSPEKPAGDDNAYTVVHINNSAASVQIAGCIVTAGSAFNYNTTTYTTNIVLPAASDETTRGAGIYSNATLTLSLCAITGNFAVGEGGGIYSSGDLTILGSTLFGNNASLAGGALYNEKKNLTITASTLSGNATGVNGGTIYNNSEGMGTLVNTQYINTTFSYSQSLLRDGGSIYNNGTNGGTLISNIINSTFVANQALSTGKGGVMYNDGQSGNVIVNIYNSIFYGNTAATSNLFFQDGTANVNLYHSSIQGASVGAESNNSVLPIAGVIYGKDPQFVSFNAMNPLTADLTLKTSSPCINAGDNTILNTLSITTDAQGGTRFYCDVTDMGAFERSNGKGLLTRSQAISLNGSSDYVNIGSVISNFNAQRDFTVEGWVKVTAYDAGATTETILSNRSGTNGANFGIAGVADAGNAGKLVLRIGNSQSIYSSGTIALGEWTHVAATFEQNGAGTNVVKFYINGHQDVTFATANDIATSTANTLIGYETASTDAINAALDEVRIWTTTRTTTEIRENMRLLHPCGAEGVLATYQFNSNTNNALELGSAAAGDYAGTAVGAPTYVTSTMPLSAGRATTFNVTGAGTHNLTGINGTSLDVTFGGTNVPNGDIIVSYLEQAASGNPLNTGLSSLDNVQYIVDNYGNDTTNLAFTLKFNAGDGASLGDAASDYKLEKRWYNTDGVWTNARIAADALNNTMGSKSISFNLTNASFGQFIPTKGSVLPVEMTTFTATLEGAAVVLDWQTATEENNAGFEINRSTDAKTWEKIGFVEGNGTVYNAQNYQFRDAAPKMGVNYYRLRQVDFDGAFAFSDVRSVLVSGKATAISFAPNPTEGNLWINLAEVNETATVQVYDLTGRLLINEIADAKNPQFVLDLSALDNGLYIVQVKGTNWQTTEKVLVKH